jgi:hypothetical protein
MTAQCHSTSHHLWYELVHADLTLTLAAAAATAAAAAAAGC